MQGIDAVLRAIGAIVAVGGGSAAIAYAIFVALGKKWLDSRFDERLEKLKHEQAKELEHVRQEISTTFSRVSKVHEREFVALPAAWEKLQEAYGAVFRVASVLKEFPDLNKMTPQQLDEFIANCRLPQFRKDELKKAQDKTAAYQEAIYWVDLGEAKQAQIAFHNYIVQNRIFMNAELREKFSNVDSQLARAINACEIGKQAGSGELLREGSGIVWNLGAAVEEVEQAVQKRLHYEDV